MENVKMENAIVKQDLMDLIVLLRYVLMVVLIMEDVKRLSASAMKDGEE
jgi:hypothetical protein